MGFTGEYLRTLDEKFRFKVPPQFRKIFKLTGTASLKAIEWVDGCVYIFPPAEWERFIEKIETSDLPPEKKTESIRLLASSTEDVFIDKHDRITIPEKFRNIMKSSNEVYINGAFRRIEVWPKSAWLEYKSKRIKDYKEKLEKVIW
jgi:MraZ protein